MQFIHDEIVTGSEWAIDPFIDWRQRPRKNTKRRSAVVRPRESSRNAIIAWWKENGRSKWIEEDLSRIKAVTCPEITTALNAICIKRRIFHTIGGDRIYLFGGVSAVRIPAERDH
jgi:hypothetical protein